MDSIHVRQRLLQLRRSQEWLAQQLSIHPSVLSRRLRGLRASDADLEARIDRVLNRETEAQRAASEARDRVLAGTPGAA